MESVRQVSPHAEPLLVISLTAILGLLFGSIRIAGIRAGVAGMLFSGLLLGHLGLSLDPHLSSFLKDFGLALFVFTVGLQLGPGFFNSLKKEGLRLNALAAGIVLTGALLAFAGGKLLAGSGSAASAGIFSGATTNTPSLGAAQQAMNAAGDAEGPAIAAMAYAVCYPFGVAGIIFTLMILRTVFRIDPSRELEELRFSLTSESPEPQRATILVENPNLEGVALGKVPGLGNGDTVVSRIRRRDETETGVAAADTILHVGDTLLVVGSPQQVERAVLAIGSRSSEDLRKAPGPVASRRVLVTHRDMIGKTIAQSGIADRYGVIVSRVSRQDMILTAMPELRLQFGDMLNLVGEEKAIDSAARALGNSVRQLNETSFASIFVGIAIGIFVGLYPWPLPGMPVPLRLGLAGGPLLIAILMGRLGRIGPLVVHMPINANTALRELGIILFLACVGLNAGGGFAETAFSPTGLRWMALGALVTLLPLLAAGFVARKWMKMNYLTLSGVLAGSMTDPPALAFATRLANSDHPSVAYAGVYPLTMLLRILAAQVAVLWLG